MSRRFVWEGLAFGYPNELRPRRVSTYAETLEEACKRFEDVADFRFWNPADVREVPLEDEPVTLVEGERKPAKKSASR